MVDNVDISSIRDVGMVTGCCFAWMVIDTKDPSIPGGKLKIMLTLDTAKRVYAVLKNLIEEDELKSELLFTLFFAAQSSNSTTKQWDSEGTRTSKICFRTFTD